MGIRLEAVLAAGIGLGCTNAIPPDCPSLTHSLSFRVPDARPASCDVYYFANTRTARYSFEGLPEELADPGWACLGDFIGPVPSACYGTAEGRVVLEFSGAAGRELSAWLDADSVETTASCDGTVVARETFSGSETSCAE
jgi:hypothetical protein